MYTVLAGPRRPLFRLGTFWPCPLFASSFPRLLPLRVSSSRLPPLRMADGGVCAQPRPFHIMNRRTNGQMRQMSGRPSLSHVGRIIICPYAFGATKSATAPVPSVQVCFRALLPCKNARPEITPYHKKAQLRFKISCSSIDPCPPFRAKRSDKAHYNLRLKIGRRFSRAEPPSRAPGPG